MRPSTLKRGDKLLITSILVSGKLIRATFVRRVPARGKGSPARNYLLFPDFFGLNGQEDDGICQMSDYELSRRGQYAP